MGGSAAHRQIGSNTSYGQRSTTMTKSALKKTKKKLAKPEKAYIGVVSSCVIPVDIYEGVDDSTGAGGMFGFQSFHPIGVNHACMITNADVVYLLNGGVITVLRDSYWSRGLVLRVLARERNLKGSICFG